jgi:magnesium-transporting ATPase (P-type)
MLVDNKQLLYRGSRLKNTEQIWGLVAYAGHCSKIMLNSQASCSKISNVERKMNIMLVWIFLIQMILCFVMAALAMASDSRLKQRGHYISWRGLKYGASQYIMYVMMFFIEYSSMIPVSLMVSIEIVKLAQSYFIDFDKLMYS